MVNLFWFRRDLRLDDNTGLNAALESQNPVLPIFIFDEDILDQLDDKSDARVNFIYQRLEKINEELKNYDSSILVLKGNVEEIFRQLTAKYEIGGLYVNRDYEPQAIERDEKVRQIVESKGIAYHDFKDQVVFEKDEILKDDGSPYTVFTPYSKKWKPKYESLSTTEPQHLKSQNFYHFSAIFPDLNEIGFERSSIEVPAYRIDDDMLRNYSESRNHPSMDACSYLSTHLRFGTVSVRKMVRIAKEGSEGYLNELIWREFFMQILYHFPDVVHSSFKKQYDKIQWINDEKEFEAWTKGMTGFPIVDAGMRELNATGLMHNRVRMIVASFLVKDLLIDWRWGEAYFANKLLDFELSSNNGNWQWAAGTGCDAAPYFRVFNPYEQARKFDPLQEYVRKWVPEVGTDQYPEPIVDHKMARQRALETYKAALN